VAAVKGAACSFLPARKGRFFHQEPGARGTNPGALRQGDFPGKISRDIIVVVKKIEEKVSF
jgi:hypothetical protein